MKRSLIWILKFHDRYPDDFLHFMQIKPRNGAIYSFSADPEVSA